MKRFVIGLLIVGSVVTAIALIARRRLWSSIDLQYLVEDNRYDPASDAASEVPDAADDAAPKVSDTTGNTASKVSDSKE